LRAIEIKRNARSGEQFFNKKSNLCLKCDFHQNFLHLPLILKRLQSILRNEIGANNYRHRHLIAGRFSDICIAVCMKKYLLLWSLLLPSLAWGQAGKEIIYVGTYSVRESKGIYVFEFNRVKGSLKLIQTVRDLDHPNFIAVHPTGQYLYSVNGAPAPGYEGSGSASAFKIDPKTGKLTAINHVSSFGDGPCHIAIDRTGEWAFVSNYNEGNFVVLPILQDGSLGAPSDSKKYFGSSVNPTRQDDSHVHSAVVSKDNKFVYVSDLGTDKIYTYAFDAIEGKITAINDDDVKVTPGAGPRHFAIHPTGTFAYSAEELTSTVGVFTRNGATGQLTVLQDTVKSLPADFSGENTSADIHTSPSGKFLFMSNRGADVISVFSINNGLITLNSTHKTLGKTPRNFLVDNQGKYLWVANQDSDNLVVFKINPTTGKLVYSGLQYKVPSPVCIRQLRLK
jgi:6-phosphogluconolactonase